MKSKKWTLADLKSFTSESKSLRELICKLGLVPAGGNYQQVKKYLSLNTINTDHFLGKG